MFKTCNRVASLFLVIAAGLFAGGLAAERRAQVSKRLPGDGLTIDQSRLIVTGTTPRVELSLSFTVWNRSGSTVRVVGGAGVM